MRRPRARACHAARRLTSLLLCNDDEDVRWRLARKGKKTLQMSDSEPGRAPRRFGLYGRAEGAAAERLGGDTQKRTHTHKHIA